VNERQPTYCITAYESADHQQPIKDAE